MMMQGKEILLEVSKLGDINRIWGKLLFFFLIMYYDGYDVKREGG